MNTTAKRPLRVFEAFAGIGAQATALKRMNIDLFDSLRTLYKDESIRAFHRLAMTDRILLWLVDHGLYKIAKFYIGLGKTLKRI